MDRAELKLTLKFLRYLLPYRTQAMAVIFLTLLGILLGLATPYITKLVIDRAFVDKDLKLFIILASLGASVFILALAAGSLQNYIDRYIQIKVNFDLSKTVFNHLGGLDLSYFEDRASAEHIYKISSDIELVKNYITNLLEESLAILPKLILTIAIIFYLSWKMALFSLCLAPLLYLPSYHYSKKIREVFKEWIEHSQSVFAYLHELFSHIRLVKAFAQEDSAIKIYGEKITTNAKMMLRNLRLENLSFFFGSLSNKLVLGCLSCFGGYQVIKGELSLGSLTAIMVYTGQLVGLQHRASWFFKTIATGIISCKRIDDILARSALIRQRPTAKEAAFDKASISLKGVSFQYDEKEPLFKGINLDFPAASYTALVGPSGCGKTTIVNLILRLYEPQAGGILIQEQDIRELAFTSLRRQIGVALQEPMLWNDTIENNIRYGNPAATEDQIRQVCRICGIDDFTRDLPKGYKTIVGEDSCKLSEGQKQRIAIARAVIKRPKILILDEAMSSIDSAEETRIMENIRRYLTGTTLIVISHRWHSIKDADRVCFLNGGNEVVTDKAYSLLKKDPRFLRLFTDQIQAK